MTVEAENVIPNHNISSPETPGLKLSTPSQTTSESSDLSRDLSCDLSREQTDISIEDEDPEFVIRNAKVQECMTNRSTWYSKSKNYWKDVPSTVDGMLGGFGSLTHADLCSSAQFLAKLYTGLNTNLAIDCGAGIGRVTKGLLLNIFDRVEMIDTCQEHLDSAQEYLGDELFSRVPVQHCCGLEDFQPKPDHYDLVWVQWVIIYLSDFDFIELLKRFKKSLKKDGYIVVKDNITNKGCEMDEDDSSVTRSDYQLKQIFKRAGLELVVDTVQRHFPRELYKVKYYALR